MLLEYAVDPAIAAEWRNLRYILELFNFSNPRRVSRFPNKGWKRMAYDAASGCSDLDKTRITELIKNLDERLWLKRNTGGYMQGKPWIENAIAEHIHHPFHAIISAEPPPSSSEILFCEDVTDIHTKIIAPNSMTLSRSAQAMGDAAQRILQHANEIIFVDPHMNLSLARYYNPLIRFLTDIQTRSDMPSIIRICLSDRKYGAPNTPALQTEFLRYIKGTIRTTLSISFCVMPEAQMHDRFILSDVGSLEFGHGLDEGTADEMLNIFMIDKSHHEILWQTYMAHKPCLIV